MTRQRDVEPVPVITVDGPAASGKGTIAAGVAQALGFHQLDSGSLYRLVALKALEAGIAPDDEARPRRASPRTSTSASPTAGSCSTAGTSPTASGAKT